MAKTSYVIALGSNRRHPRHGAPRNVLAAACEAVADKGIDVLDRAPIFATAAVGPAGRSFANSAILIRSKKKPDALLAILKKIERRFGRRRGRRWGPRVLDLDIILWSEGYWVEQGIAVPHPGFRQRRFVLDPVAAIAPAWRDPVTGLTIRHIRARLMHAKPVDRREPAA